MPGTITAANSILLLGVASVYPVPQQIQEFGADDAFTNSSVAIGESRVGVDGYGVGGYIPSPVPMSIRLLPGSLSITFFENWIRAMHTLGDVLYANGQVTMKSVGLKYAMPLGMLMDVQTMADVRRVLADREFRINWLPNGPQQPAVTSSPV